MAATQGERAGTEHSTASKVFGSVTARKRLSSTSGAMVITAASLSADHKPTVNSSSPATMRVVRGPGAAVADRR